MDRLWTAKWITDGDFASLRPNEPMFGQRVEREQTDENGLPLYKNRRQIFRHVFDLPERRGRVYAYVSGDDFYKLYLNGTFVCMGPAPGYPFHYWYARVDVTRYLHPGKNLIAAEVLYQGYVNRVTNSADGRMGFICEIRDSRRVYAATDETWETGREVCWMPAGVAGYDSQTLDILDAARWDGGWKTEQDFHPACMEMYPASVCLCDWHVLYEQPTPTVQTYPVRPARIRRQGEGLMLDFGKETVASLVIRCRGGAGDALRIRYSEELQEDGSLRYPMRCIKNAYEDRVIFSGGEDTFEPFEYKAFRYVELCFDPYSGTDRFGDLARIAEGLTAVVRHYPMAENACRFASDHATMNAAWRICKHGVRLGTQEGYLDCPSREKGQYLGDAVVTAHSQFLLTGDARQYRKAIYDFARSSAVDPGLLCIAPGSLTEKLGDYSLMYPYFVENYIRLTGDRSVLDVLPVIEGMLRHFARHMRPDGLLCDVTDTWNMVDWPLGETDGYEYDLENRGKPGCHNVINALWYGAVDGYVRLCEMAGRTPAPPVEASRVAESFRRVFGGGEGGLFRDLEGGTHCAYHSNIYPLFFGMTDASETEAVLSMLRRRRICGSVFTAYFTLMALVRRGETPLACELAFGEGERSWSHMIREGATSCFEAWGKDMKWNTSFCHAWASTPIPLICEGVMGLSPVDPVKGEYALRPCLPSGVTRARLSIRLSGGSLTVVCEEGQKPQITATGRITVKEADK